MENYRHKYLKHILSGNQKDALDLTNLFLAEGNSQKELYENVLKPALYDIGRMWEQNKISVAAEHLATAITEGVLNALYPNIIPEKYNNKKVVLCCVDNEEHQVGIKMVADLFEMHEWESFYLGTGFPASELISWIDSVKPDIIAISLSVYFNYSNLKKMHKDLVMAFPETNIIIGGQAIRYIPDDKRDEWENVTFINDLEELDEYITNLS
jgi:methanogenic corrinoid protein MtbC1